MRGKRIARKLPAYLVFQVLRIFLPRRYRLVRPRKTGFKMYLDLTESPMMVQRFLGSYESRKTRLFLSEVRPGMIIADIGVNKGYFSLMAASLLEGTGRVLAFEPSPDNCEWIRRSIAANGFDNIKLYEVALAAAEGRTILHLGTTSGSHSITTTSHARSGDSVMVEVNSLDNILAKEAIDEVHMMKIDVEGAEELVIEGASNLLRRANRLAVAVDLHPQYGVDPERIVEKLEKLGFDVMTMSGEPLSPSERRSAREVLARKG